MSDISSVEWLPTFGHRFLRHNPLGPLPAYAYGAYGDDPYFSKDSPKDLDDEKGTGEKSKEPKPSYSYASLIRLAITNCPKGKMTLSEIYQYIIATFPYYRDAGTGWKNSIRHNLSLNKCFRKLARGKDDPGKGSYWAIDVNYSQDDAPGKRRRGLHCLRGAPYSPECSSNSSGEAGSTSSSSIKNKEHGDGTEPPLLKQEVKDAPEPAAAEDSLSVLDLFSASFSPPECDRSVLAPRVCSSGRHRGTHTDRYGNFNEQVEEECNCSPFDETENSQIKAVNIPGYSQYSTLENPSANYETGYSSFSSCSEVCSPVQTEVGFFNTPGNVDNNCISSYADYKYGSYAGQNCDYTYSRNDNRNGIGFDIRNEESPLNGFDCL